MKKGTIVKSEQFEEQAQFVKDNIDVVLEDIKENQGFLSKEKVEQTLDYENEGVFSRGNWIKPAGSERVISYRIFVSVYEKGTYEQDTEFKDPGGIADE